MRGPSCHVYWMIEVDGGRKWNEVEVSKMSVLGSSEPGKSEWRFQMECEKACGRGRERGVNVLFLKRKVEMWENRGRGPEAMSLYILNIDW